MHRYIDIDRFIDIEMKIDRCLYISLDMDIDIYRDGYIFT